MKKKVATLLLCGTLIALTGCSSGVSQEEYDEVVKERDELQEKYDRLLDEYAGDLAEQTINEIEEKANEPENSDTLEDYQESEPIFSHFGSGDDVVTGMTTDSVSFAHIVHNGDGYFSVKGHHDGSYDLLASTTEPYDGITLIYPGDEYTFEIGADGDWSIEVYKLGTSSTDTFSGNGDYVTPIFLKTSNTYEVSTTGGGYFAVKGWGDSGYDLLVSETDDNYSGTVMFDNGEDYAFFQITASREWEIKPVD